MTIKIFKIQSDVVDGKLMITKYTCHRLVEEELNIGLPSVNIEKARCSGVKKTLLVSIVNFSLFQISWIFHYVRSYIMVKGDLSMYLIKKAKNKSNAL